MRATKAICLFISTLSVGLVLGITAFLLAHGGSSITWDFLTKPPSGFPLGAEGGIAPAIAGTLCLGVVAVCSGGLMALGTAIYLSDLRRQGILATVVRLSVTLIAGTPSIVLGLFGYSFFVVTAGMGISLLSAGLVLGIMIYPYMEVRFESSIRRHSKILLIPAMSIGMSRSWGMMHLVLPAARKDLWSAVAQATGFAIGATAPIMFTGAVFHTGMPSGLSSPVMALPVHLYILVSQGIAPEKAYGTALVLTAIVFIVNFLSYGRKR